MKSFFETKTVDQTLGLWKGGLSVLSTGNTGQCVHAAVYWVKVTGKRSAVRVLHAAGGWLPSASFNEASMHLGLATSSRTWLMLLNVMINMVSMVNYDNKLKQALFSIKLRLNNVNTSAKKVGIWDMDGRLLKINW